MKKLSLEEILEGIESCKNLNAAELMKAKRAHWSIENSLHWFLICPSEKMKAVQEKAILLKILIHCINLLLIF